MSEPYLVGAKGERVEAKLEVHDCEVDRNPAAPWDRLTVDPGARECELVVSWNDEGLSYPAVLDPPWSATGNSDRGAHESHGDAARQRASAGDGVAGAGAQCARARRFAILRRRPLRRRRRCRPGAWITRRDAAQQRPCVRRGRWHRHYGDRVVPESAIRTAGTWSAAAGMPSQRWRHSAIVSGFNVLVVGGTNGSVTHPNSRICNTAATPGRRRHLVAGQERLTLTRSNTAQGSIVAVGPMPRARKRSTRSTQVWAALPSQPAAARRSHVAISTHRGLLIAGGVGATGSRHRQCGGLQPDDRRPGNGPAA